MIFACNFTTEVFHVLSLELEKRSRKFQTTTPGEKGFGAGEGDREYLLSVPIEHLQRNFLSCAKVLKNHDQDLRIFNNFVASVFRCCDNIA